MPGHDLFPAVAEYLEWIGGDAGNFVVGAVHDELDAAGQGAELADDQTVADERKVVEDVAFEILRILRVIVIGVLPDDDMWIGNRVLDKAHLGKPRHRVLV